jgi:hypothetical protein
MRATPQNTADSTYPNMGVSYQIRYKIWSNTSVFSIPRWLIQVIFLTSVLDFTFLFATPE